jgi:hypothetical protein
MYQPFEIITKFNLDNYLKVVIQKSTSNKAPYHNFYHVMCMIKNVYDIAKSLGLSDDVIRLLLIAVLFHDFNHSMGKHDDVWNVDEAIKCFLLYSIESSEDNEKIINIIRATQYPYVIEEKDLTVEQEIIRDADLLQQYQDNFIQQVYWGLSQELNYSFEIMLAGYPNFIEGMRLHTKHAQEIHDNFKEERSSTVKYLLNLLQ